MAVSRKLLYLTAVPLVGDGFPLAERSCHVSLTSNSILHVYSLAPGLSQDLPCRPQIASRLTAARSPPPPPLLQPAPNNANSTLFHPSSREALALSGVDIGPRGTVAAGAPPPSPPVRQRGSSPSEASCLRGCFAPRPQQHQQRCRRSRRPSHPRRAAAASRLQR